jgi:23S rRNA (cytosine1962-C5)-methyltransferase
MTEQIPGYALLDSGDQRKLERFGSTIINRPSSLSAWKRRLPASAWEKADATYLPPDRWEFRGKPFTTWEATVAGVNLQLELMSNGQLGIFPEHALYLPLLRTYLDKLHHKAARPLKILNLFAYTGLATAFCAKLPHTFVTHVDLAKRAIEWAKKNATANEIGTDKVRWITDDALGFMARENRKGNRYDIVIIDPPSFSRVSKNNTWTLEEKAPEIVSLCLSVLEPAAGAVFFTNHSTASTSDVARNIMLDHFQDRDVETSIESLSLAESNTPRLLPAGSLIVLSHAEDGWA